MAFLLVFDKKYGFAIDVKFRKFYFVSPLNKSFGQVLRLMLNSGNFILCPHSTKVLARFCVKEHLFTQDLAFFMR